MSDRIMATGDTTYEFTVITSFAKNVKDKGGNEELKVIKPEVTYRLRCNTADITAVLESFNKNGNIMRGRCCVYHKDYKELLVKGDYHKMCNIIFPDNGGTRIGYGSGN